MKRTEAQFPGYFMHGLRGRVPVSILCCCFLFFALGALPLSQADPMWLDGADEAPRGAAAKICAACLDTAPLDVSVESFVSGLRMSSEMSLHINLQAAGQGVAHPVKPVCRAVTAQGLPVGIHLPAPAIRYGVLRI